RRDEGSLAAFHNVCRHRAAPLLWEDRAEPCAVLRCRYHGWRYGLDGKLLATPGFGEIVEPEGMGLHPIQLRAWRGILFVCFAPNPPLLSIEGLEVAAAGLSLEGLVAHRRTRHRLRCGWKTYVENYLEGYHIPWLHPGLSPEISQRGYRVEVAGRAAIHRVPTRPGAVSEGFWAWVWPNMAINVYTGGMSLEVMNPVGPAEMEIVYTYLFQAALSDAEREATIAMSAEVTAEDVQICEAVQRNLSAGVYESGRLSPQHEGAVAAFQDWVRAALAPGQ
ncbi:MAG: choline monooxygenase, partial [Myxococcota bacterium]